MIGVVATFFALAFAGALSAQQDHFESRIRPVLVDQCLSCHSGERPQGSLRLDNRHGWEAGGKSGPTIVPGDPAKGSLLRALRHESGVTAMPLGAKKLAAAVIADFEKWIRDGAFDPRNSSTAPRPAGKSWAETYAQRKEWWSLKPVSRPAPPVVRHAQWSRNPIDRFLVARMDKAGLRPAPPAGRTTLARRVSFVLTGLPPAPRDVYEFTASRDPKAFEKLVDRLLTSVHFGEHWARHWMDVVRYSDTYGYEWDIPAKGAWRYRDYLIRAFVNDVPFDQLVREQIAGDLLPNPRVDSAAGINESLIGPMFYQMGEKRHGDSLQFNGIHQEMLNDKVDAFSKSFQAMTVACARCHDHKLDAVSQRDYYALAGMFMSSRWVSNTLDTARRHEETLDRLSALKPRIRELAGQSWLNSLGGIASVKTDPKTKPAIEDPMHIWAELEKSEDVAAAWRSLRDTYAKTSRERHETNARDYTPLTGWSTDGVGLRRGPVAKGEFAVATEGPSPVAAVMPSGFFTNALSPRMNGALRTPVLNHSGRKFVSVLAAGGDFSAHRLVVDNAYLTERQTYLKTIQPKWTKLSAAAYEKGNRAQTKAEAAETTVWLEFATKTSNPNFPPRVGLGGKCTDEEARDPRSWFGFLRAVTHDVDAPPADELSRFSDLFRGDDPATLPEASERFRQWARRAIEAWRGNRATEDDVWVINWAIESKLVPGEMTSELRAAVDEYRSIEKQLPTPETVNGMADIDPGRDYRLNVRGVYEDLGPGVPRGYIEVLGGARPRPGSRSGRLELAEAVTNPLNPLTARVFVNRVWHWVFGAGLVATVDDFGHLGDKPSHPELLDYLAGEFVRNGWSMRKLIRSLVLSEAFQQAGAGSLKAQEADPLNRLLTWYPVRRLEAESLRDSILAVSGRLDRTAFGEPADPPRAKEDPEKRLYSGPLDGNGRRSIYTKMTIMEPPRFLATFNQPAPKIPAGRRDQTIVPAQALALLNDPFVTEQAGFWARRIDAVAPADRVTHMFREAFGRPPDPAETARWTTAARDFAEIHRDNLDSVKVWKEVAHAMFNAKEFLYVR
ncbi:MAG: DUF1553 domain-containing protein [Acidobacteria bacterium]|nr:DUF1553 domain-containing protein [Acidobacteriota bacterium]